MAEEIKFANTSNIIRFTLKDKTTGQGKTGLSSSTAGLIISTLCDNEAAPTTYTQAASHIESITTLATFATPTSLKCRFKEVDSTNHKGLYEFQFADARFAISGSKKLIISVNDAESTILDADYLINLVQYDPYNFMRGNSTYDLRQIAIMTWEIVMSGKISNLPSSPATLRNFEDTADRATLAFDGNNNRTAVTIVTPP